VGPLLYDLYHEPCDRIYAEFCRVEGVLFQLKVVAYENDTGNTIDPDRRKVTVAGKTQLGRFLLPEEYLVNNTLLVGDSAKNVKSGPDDLRPGRKCS